MPKSSKFSTIHRQQRMLKALIAHCGIVTRAAKAAGITPQTHYNWHNESEQYAAQVDLIKFECYEDFKDMVMEAVVKKIQQGNTTIIATCFKTVYGKWPEQMERANPFKGKIKVALKLAPLPDHWEKDPFTQGEIMDYEERLKKQREGGADNP